MIATMSSRFTRSTAPRRSAPPELPPPSHRSMRLIFVLQLQSELNHLKTNHLTPNQSPKFDVDPVFLSPPKKKRAAQQVFAKKDWRPQRDSNPLFEIRDNA
jgi:hypothetical protein